VKSKIGVSTGIFLNFYEDEEINRRIAHIARWDVDQVEILFNRQFTLDIPITKENKEFLRRKEVTLHAPFFHNEGYEKFIITRVEIEKLVKIAKDLNAKHIIVHGDILEDMDILNDYDVPFVIENIKPKLSEEFSLQNIKSIFEKYPKLKLAFDAGHAKDLSKEEIEKYLKELDNTEEVHFAIKDFKAFLKGEETDLYYLKDYCKSIVIESRLERLGKIPLIITKLREIFS